jgi:hypothetical protein
VGDAAFIHHAWGISRETLKNPVSRTIAVRAAAYKAKSARIQEAASFKTGRKVSRC